MAKRIKYAILTFLAVFFLALTLNVGAVSLDQAVSQVRAQTNGKVLSAKTVRKGNRRVHRIKVLTPRGKVRVIEIPAGDRR